MHVSDECWAHWKPLAGGGHRGCKGLKSAIPGRQVDTDGGVDAEALASHRAHSCCTSWGQLSTFSGERSYKLY